MLTTGWHNSQHSSVCIVIIWELLKLLPGLTPPNSNLIGFLCDLGIRIFESSPSDFNVQPGLKTTGLTGSQHRNFLKCLVSTHLPSEAPVSFSGLDHKTFHPNFSHRGLLTVCEIVAISYSSLASKYRVSPWENSQSSTGAWKLSTLEPNLTTCLFLKIKCYWDTATSICLHIVHGCFQTMAAYNSRDAMAVKAETIYSLDPNKKNLLTNGLKSWSCQGAETSWVSEIAHGILWKVDSHLKQKMTTSGEIRTLVSFETNEPPLLPSI